jgi:hypothetical protein
MSDDRFTSRVFDAGLALFDKLSAIDYPPHPVTGGVPPVEFGDENPDAGAEKICIVLDVEQTDTEWARLGAAGRDEPMVFSIVIRSWVPVPGQTTRDVWVRLSQLSAAVEDVLYDRDTRKVRLLGFDGELPVSRVAGVKPTVFPSEQSPFGDVVVTTALLATI